MTTKGKSASPKLDRIQKVNYSSKAKKTKAVKSKTKKSK